MSSLFGPLGIYLSSSGWVLDHCLKFLYLILYWYIEPPALERGKVSISSGTEVNESINFRLLLIQTVRTRLENGFYGVCIVACISASSQVCEAFIVERHPTCSQKPSWANRRRSRRPLWFKQSDFCVSWMLELHIQFWSKRENTGIHIYRILKFSFKFTL